MFFERPELGRRAVLLSLEFDAAKVAPSGRSLAAIPQPQETRELAEGAGIKVCALVRGKRRTPHPRFFAGKGKLEEVRAVMQAEGAELLLLNHDVGPSQQRNLESELDVRVMPRTELILHIFADRARSHEGQLQVELAQLQHAQTRLVRGWTHLDRQKGGIGLRGAGETQIEMDQRMIGERIKMTARKLEEVAKRRARGRARRSRQRVPSVSLVGYTNAGKSTLFNALTTAEVLAEDRLFATLDPTLRRLSLQGGHEVILGDTVGFISQLPHSLVEAFKSTLEEVAHADALLHVVDASAPDMIDQVLEVNAVLAEIGAADVPRILVLNKIDVADSNTEDGAETLAERLTLLDSAASALPDDLIGIAGDDPAAVAHRRSGGLGSLAPEVSRIPVSAVTGAGIDALRTALAAQFGGLVAPAQVELHAGDGKTRSWLYSLGVVSEEDFRSDGKLLLEISADASLLATLAKRSDIVLRGIDGVPRIAALPN
ncbi:MAG: GTPase HflX [Pseudomonadales bacterium]